MSSQLPTLDHVSLLVTDVEEAIATYLKVLGLPPERGIYLGPVSDGDDVVVCGYIELDNCKLEFCAPASDSGPFAAQLDKRGVGLHHVAFSASEESADLDAHAAHVKDQGFRLTDPDLRTDDYGVRYTYVHPRDTLGALVCISDPSDVEVLRRAERDRVARDADTATSS